MDFRANAEGDTAKALQDRGCADFNVWTWNMDSPANAEGDTANALQAVSYTHLDVYKRQQLLS